MFLQYTKYRDIDAVTWHDACHVTKSPRLSLRFSFGRVKGHTWNYCAEGGRAWERGYVYLGTRGGWKHSRDHALPHARLYILLIEKLFLLQRQVAC